MKLFYTAMAAAALMAAMTVRADDAVNYFGVEGTTWTVEHISTATPEGLVSFGGLVMENPQTVQGRECMQISGIGDTGNRPVGYIAAEGEKVYFLDSTNSVWLPMYDFGLRPGESTVIYGASTELVMGSSEIQGYEVMCRSVEQAENGPEMLHVSIHSIDVDTRVSGWIEDEVWIRGLGSASGPLGNDIFSYDGVGTVLIDAQSGGETLYSHRPYIPVDETYVNYFGRKGAKWTTCISGVSLDAGDIGAQYVRTLGEPSVRNYRAAWPVLEVHENGEPVETGYWVSAYMNRVWLAAPDLKWRLIYDFGLEPGRVATVYGNIDITKPEWDAIEYLAECVEVGPAKGNAGLEEMKVHLTPTAMNGYGIEGEQTWIRSVGGYAGMLVNDVPEIVGIASVLESLTYDGKEVYRKPATSPYGRTVCEGRTWDYYLDKAEWDNPGLSGLKTGYHFDGTMEVAGREYAVFRDGEGEPVALMREENRKVYLYLPAGDEKSLPGFGHFVDPGWYGEYEGEREEVTGEILLYDFALQTGDRFVSVGFDNKDGWWGALFEFEIDSTSSFEFGGQEYAVMDIKSAKDPDYFTYTQIEGVGNTKGLLPFPQMMLEISSPFTTTYYVVRVTDANGGVLYQDNNFWAGVTVPVASEEPAAIYDMLGRRVAVPVAGGIYVRDGRKVIWK